MYVWMYRSKDLAVTMILYKTLWVGRRNNGPFLVTAADPSLAYWNTPRVEQKRKYISLEEDMTTCVANRYGLDTKIVYKYIYTL